MNSELPKVIPLLRNDVVDLLESMLEMAKAGEIRTLIVAGHMASGHILTAVEANAIEHHTLNSYLQTNAILRTVEQNLNM